LILVSAASRRHHGAAGDFDLDLILNGASTEPRNGGVQSLLLTFNKNPFPKSGVIDCSKFTILGGACTSVSQLNKVLTVNMTSTPNLCVSVAAHDLTDSDGRDLEGVSSVLFNNQKGDVNGGGGVNLIDLQGIKNQLLKPVTAANFNLDVHV